MRLLKDRRHRSDGLRPVRFPQSRKQRKEGPWNIPFLPIPADGTLAIAIKGLDAIPDWDAVERLRLTCSGQNEREHVPFDSESQNFESRAGGSMSRVTGCDS